MHGILALCVRREYNSKLLNSFTENPSLPNRKFQNSYALKFCKSRVPQSATSELGEKGERLLPTPER